MISNSKLLAVFDKTNGHCHFCGDALIFNKYGYKNNKTNGAWEADHVIQKGKGGNKNIENCLPTCIKCNRLRWHRTGDNLRELILLGLIAKDEINKKSETGKLLSKLKLKRLLRNQIRRRNIISILKGV
jgi:5-methylcytosine-specific restriction endonuclease McrA